MRNYTITVNGKAYNVTVEEGTSAPVVTAAPVAAAAPQAAPAPAQAPAAGGISVTAPMTGKILGVKAAVGQVVKKGDVLVILEAMKMENDIVATADGTVASIAVKAGDAVEAGDLIATLN